VQRASPWKEKLHPRDPNGKFAGAGGAPPGRVLSGRDAHESVSRPQDIGGATDPELDAVLVYQQYAHTAINQELRHGASDPKMRRHAENLQSLINRSEPIEHPIQVVRGISGGDAFLGPVGSRTGKTFTDNGFVSTTASPRVLRDRFSGDTKLSIKVPAGSKAIRMMSDTVEGLDEREILLPAGTKFKVVSDRRVNGTRNVSLEVIDTPADKLPDPPDRKPEHRPAPAAPDNPAADPTPTGNPKLDALNKSLAAYQKRLETDPSPQMQAAYKTKIAQIKAQIKKEKKGG